MFKHIVFGGGGVKGLSYSGAIKILDIHNMLDNIKDFVGTSVGSIYALMLALDYTADEIIEISLDMDLNVYDFDIKKLFSHYGLDSGIHYVNIFKKLIKKKLGNENATFKDLHNYNGNNLIITGTNINKHCVTYFSYENTPDVKLCHVVRLSIGIPFFFTAVNYKGDYYVDGGLMDNYPIHLFDSNVIGFKLKQDEQERHDIDDIESFAIHLGKCCIHEIEKLRLNDKMNDKNTVIIDTNNVHMMQFDISLEDKKKLFLDGLGATDEFITSILDKE